MFFDSNKLTTIQLSVRSASVTVTYVLNLLNTFRFFVDISQMPPPKRRIHVTRTQTGKLRKRAPAAVGTPTAAPDVAAPDVAAPDVAAGTAPLADAIAAVMRQLEQSGRLLPASGPEPVRASRLAEAVPRASRLAEAVPRASRLAEAVPSASTSRNVVDADSDDSDQDGVDAVLSGLLGGELYTHLPTYNVVNRPLGANLSDSLKARIRRGDYINLQLLLIDDDTDDDINEQQHQRLTLEITAIGQQDALSLVKPTRTKAITTIHQWVTAFSVYAAVLTENSPHQAPGLFKHIADITEMSRRFRGMAWCRYDTAFRREMGANHLMFGQVNWDLRFRCLEQASHKPGNYSFRGNATRTPYMRNRGTFAVGNKTFQKGQCFQFEQFGACPHPTCPFKHTCAKCSGKHPTNRCNMRSARPHSVRRGGAVRPANTNRQ